MEHLYHIPGKIFLLGEYSVLQGMPALVAAIRLVSGESYYGYGSSTAKWILERTRQNGIADTDIYWSEYRKDNPRASGADLIAQSEALKNKGNVFQIQILPYTVTSIPENPLWDCIHVFSAASFMARKLNTDQHLKSLPSEIEFPDPTPFIQKFLNAQSVSDFECLSEWADLFTSKDIETKSALLDRGFIRSLNGVTGVKGCGAGLNDVFLVAIDPSKVSSVPELTRLISEEKNLNYQGTLHKRLWSSNE